MTDMAVIPAHVNVDRRGQGGRHCGCLSDIDIATDSNALSTHFGLHIVKHLVVATCIVNISAIETAYSAICLKLWLLL